MHILAPQHLVSDTYAMARFLKLHRENHHFFSKLGLETQEQKGIEQDIDNRR